MKNPAYIVILSAFGVRGNHIYGMGEQNMNETDFWSYILGKHIFMEGAAWLDISVLLHMYMSMLKEKKEQTVAS